MTKIRKLQIASLLASLLYFALVMSSPHILRASFLRVSDVSDAGFFRLSPEQLHGVQAFEEGRLLSAFRQRIPGETEAPGFRVLEATLRWFGEQLAQRTKQTENYVPESPASTMEYLWSRGIRGSGYNDAILFNTFLQSLGFKARLVEFLEEDGLGQRGHMLSEVWLPEFKKWALVDVQQVTLFISTKNGAPLSAPEIRQLVLTKSEEEFNRDTEIRQFPGFFYPAKAIWALYHSTAKDLALWARSDFHRLSTRSWVQTTSGKLERQGGKWGENAVKAGRLFRSAFSDAGTRLRLNDDLTPFHLFAFWWWATRAFGLLFVLTFFSLFFLPRAKSA